MTKRHHQILLFEYRVRRIQTLKLGEAAAIYDPEWTLDEEISTAENGTQRTFKFQGPRLETSQQQSLG